MSELRAPLEQALAERFAAGDLGYVATLLLEGYGAELYAYLAAVLRSPEDGGEAFQIFAEELWKALPRFRGEASFRTWAYALARHAGFRLFRERRRRGRQVPLSAAPEVLALAERVRSTTLPHLRQEAEQRLALLRQRLTPEEQSLLILRLDRRMSWQDVARVMEGPALEPAELERAASTLRKRFQRAKDKLRDLVP